jgi:hypothetical protein
MARQPSVRARCHYTATQPVPLLPLPAMKKIGLPSFETLRWLGRIGPDAMPAMVVTALQTDTGQ